MGNKKRLLPIIIVFFVALVVAAGILIRKPDKKPLDAQQIKLLPDPELVAEKFLHALIEDNISLAKELVIPTQRARIDQWKTETEHKAFECPYDWRYFWNKPIQVLAWGGTGAIAIDNETVNASSSYGCSNNNQSMSIDDVIVKNNREGWTIIDWGMICETPVSYDESEKCYP